MEKNKKCQSPGSNQGPLDLQSNALPTELLWQHTGLTFKVGIGPRLLDQ